MHDPEVGMQLYQLAERTRRLMMSQRTFKGQGTLGLPLLALISEHKQAGSAGGVRVSDLSGGTCLPLPAVSRMIGELEAKGLVTRKTAAYDRRVVVVDMTESGEEALEEAKSRLCTFGSRIAGELGERDTGELIRLLGRLCDVIEKKEGQSDE